MHRAALRLLDGAVGVEDDRAARRAGARVQAPRDRLRGRVGVDARMQELVELGGIDPDDRLLAVDQALVDHVDGRLQRGRGRALRRARLEHVEDVVLDRELDVLHVAVVLLEAPHRRQQELVGGRHRLPHRLDRLGRADARDDVLALGVDEELAVELLLAGRGVAGERDAGAGALALVPEDHLNDVDGGADLVGDVVRAPVDLRARRLPRVEDGTHGPHQLRRRLLRERAGTGAPVDLPVGADELGQVVGVEIGVERDAALSLQRGQRVLEGVRVDAVDDLAVHLDQPPVGVVGEPPVARGRREALDRLVVQAEVEDRVHHPRHRDRRARAHGEEKRVGGVAEALAGRLLEPAQVLDHLRLEPLRQVAGRHVGAAGVGRDREAGRDGQPERRHLGEPGALAAEELAPASGRIVEVEDHSARSHRVIVTTHRRRRARNSASHASERSANQNGTKAT